MFKNKNLKRNLVISFFFLTIIFILLISLLKKNNPANYPIKVKLITSVHKDLPFKFETNKKNITIVPGEIKTINYTVKNLSQENITGMATFQVYPNELKEYMTKMNCFCYEAQTLKGGKKEKYALVLLVDPKVTKNIKEAIIQFIFFKK